MNKTLSNSEVWEDPLFGLQIPGSCPDVPEDILNPRATWSDKEAYKRTAKDLVHRFTENFKRYTVDVDAGVVAAGPKVENS